jgi:predicted benzoate:H+ symporter BenE
MGLSCYVVSSQIGGKENQGARGLANIIMLCSTVSIIGLLGMGSSILGSVLGITGGIVGLSSGYRKSD